MDANLEKTYKKQLKISGIILLVAAIVSIGILVTSIQKQILANTLQKENDGLKNEILLLKKENAELKK